MIDRYNEQVALLSERCKAAGRDAYKMAMDLAHPGPRNITWTREQFTDLSRGKLCELGRDGVRVAEYRPFCKQWVYFNRRLNNCIYQQPKLYPTAKHRNLAIQLTGNGATKDFSCLMENILPDLEVISKGLCFPLYWYLFIETSPRLILKCALEAGVDAPGANLLYEHTLSRSMPRVAEWQRAVEFLLC